MAKLSWPPDDKHKVKYAFKDERELNDQNGMIIPFESNKKLSKDKETSR